MVEILLVAWIASALLIIRENEFSRMIIYLSVFALIFPLCFFLLASPDVAMAAVVISVFSTIIYVISFEKYYSHTESTAAEKKTPVIKKYILPVIFTAFLFVLFIWFIPKEEANPYLRDQYLSRFQHDIGGENAVTSIYLGYRLYDTLLEALMLLVGIAAIIHLSWYKDFFVSQEIYIGIKHSQIAVDTIRIICPILVLFSIYLMVNGHITPGGGFQAGVIAASFFICRYMIHDIYDIPIGKVIKLKKFFYMGIVLLAMCFLFLIVYTRFPELKIVYLVMMNLLIGFKVACSFVIIFFRFIAFERR